MIKSYDEYVELNNRAILLQGASPGTNEYYELVELEYLLEKYEQDELTVEDSAEGERS